MLSQALRYARLTDMESACLQGMYWAMPPSASLTHCVPLAQWRVEKPERYESCYPCLVWEHRLTPATMKDIWVEKPQALCRLCAGAEDTGDLGWVLFYNLLYNLQLSHITSQSLSIPICKWGLLVPFSKAGPKNNTTPHQMLICIVIYKALLKDKVLMAN